MKSQAKYPSFISLCVQSIYSWTVSSLHWMFMALVLVLGVLLELLKQPRLSWLLDAFERLVLVVKPC